PTPEAKERVADVKAFLLGPLASKFPLSAERLQRAVPFVHLVEFEGLTVLLQGQFDLVVRPEAGPALLLDVQVAHAVDPLPPQELLRLASIALAAREQLGGGVELKTGVVFLKDRTGQAVFPALPSDKELRGELATRVGQLRASRQSGVWPGL